MNDLHPIDRIDPIRNDGELEGLMVFCLLDRANLYETVCRCYNILEAYGLVTRRGIRLSTIEQIEMCLRSGGHRFPRQTAASIKAFGDNQIDLRVASRQELVDGIQGIGWKLASMFVRNTRGSEVAVIDVHIKNFLRRCGHEIDSMTYAQMEDLFMSMADSLGVSVIDLDLEIWNASRRGNKKGVEDERKES